MNIDILSKNHYSLSTFADVNEICQPFFKKTGINFFAYCRHYKDGSFYSLSTHREYYLYHFQKEYPLGPTVQELFTLKKLYHFPLSGGNKQYDQMLHEIAEQFNISHPFYIVERYLDYFDMVIFGAEPKKLNIINFYLNYSNVLENFKVYFVERAEKLINRSEKNKIVLPFHMRPSENTFIAATQSMLQFSKSRKTNKIYLNDPSKGYLTQREFECVKLLILGKSAEEIGIITGLSKRTVEKYLENIKNRFSCKKTTQLIYELTKAGLII